jgi:hypothetical protein
MLHTSRLWILAAALGLLPLASAGAQVRPDVVVVGDGGAAALLYEGVSQHGNLEEALNDAVARAQRDLPGADRMVRWRLREVSGEQGGIRGARTLRVTIEVVREQPAQPPVPAPPGGGSETLRRWLKTNLTITPPAPGGADEASFALKARNTGTEAVQVAFPTSQQVEFEVWREKHLVWRWSQGRVFTQALSSLILSPGRDMTWRATWNLSDGQGHRVAPGRYTVRAYLPAQMPGPRIGTSGTLTVPAGH